MESVGKYLKGIREEKKYTIEDVYNATKLKKYIIMHIENDDFEAIGGMGPARIMITTYCRFLGVDLDQIQEKISDKPDTPPEDTVILNKKKAKRAILIRPSTLYFIFLVMLIVVLSITIIRIYRNDNLSFDAIRNQLANTEYRPRTSPQQIEVTPDTLWMRQRQIFVESNNIESIENRNPQIERIRMFNISRNEAITTTPTLSIPTNILLNDETDYVNIFIFKNVISPLNPEV